MKLTKTVWKIIKIYKDVYQNAGLLSPSEADYLQEVFVTRLLNELGIQRYFMEKTIQYRVANHQKMIDICKKNGYKGIKSMSTFKKELYVELGYTPVK